MDSLSFRRCRTLKLHPRRNLSKKDRISRLHDDILVCVLSFLTMTEAGTTSLLLKRWKHVWAYVPLLIFDGSKISNEVSCDYFLGREKYVHWVDRVLSLHKAPTVNEFRIRFPLGAGSRDFIDNWVRFAAEKRVKRLELKLDDTSEGCFLYNFPSVSFCNSLTSLQLDCVNVTGEVLESLIFNCKALEFLSVTESHVLVDFKVFSQSLKSLRISCCYKLKILEIDAQNLISLDYYYGHKTSSISFNSTPKLVELSIGGISKPDMIMGSITHQIEVLNLDIIEIEPLCTAFPKFTKLKTLDVSYYLKCEKFLFCAGLLLKACPFLQKFVIQLHLSDLTRYSKKWKINGEEPWCHYHLKNVEIIGFAGSALGFATYLIKQAVSLGKLTIDPRKPYEVSTRGMHVISEKTIKACEQAEKLLTDLRPETKLEIRFI